MNELKIEYLNPADLTPYENNTRKHNPEDIEGIKKSILDTGFNDPIGVWGENNLIVEGHGRQIAAMELHLDKVPVIRLDHMTEAQRKEYAIRHNRSAELSAWDFETLEQELASLAIDGINMDDLNFSFDFDEMGENGANSADGFYTDVINIPQYEPVGECPAIADMIDVEKYNKLHKRIEEADIDEEVKQFLYFAASRHIGFNYKTIANYYAHQPKEIQELMEESALVIIDLKDAIANGYAELSNVIDEMIEENEDEE